ncbi:MAG: DNA translocase FtsK, partial [Planctomycetia bacterium]
VHPAAEAASAVVETPTKIAAPVDAPAPAAKSDPERVVIIHNNESRAKGQGAPVRTSTPTAFRMPELSLLDDVETVTVRRSEDEMREQARRIEKTFAEFQMKVAVVQIDTGPVVTQYEIELEPGLRSKKVAALADDLAIALRAPSVRVIAPIPGKNTVGVEVPNEQRAKVQLKEIMLQAPPAAANMRLPLFLGKDVKGNPLVCDLATMPHLLIAGRTGTGKSVCLNSIIVSLLMSRTPEQVKLLMVDPKMVELSLYRSIPNLLHPVVTEMQKAEALLAWAVEKMEERYMLLARVGVRHLDSYNKMPYGEILRRVRGGGAEDDERMEAPEQLPYIVIIIDEMADLIMQAKEAEAHIIRLAQKSRAVGIHLILATQKPTVDVITGLIKSNMPARIAFQVMSRVDSRVVLDEMGAERLLGCGDMLFLTSGSSKLLRAQGSFVSDGEVERVTEFVATLGAPEFAPELLARSSAAMKPEAAGDAAPAGERDEMYYKAVDVVVREKRGSVSLLQRALGMGYGRAARMIAFMAEDGIV